MDDLLRLISVLNGTLAALPQVMEQCVYADDEKLKVIADDMLTQTCSGILAATRAILFMHKADK